MEFLPKYWDKLTLNGKSEGVDGKNVSVDYFCCVQ